MSENWQVKIPYKDLLDLQENKERLLSLIDYMERVSILETNITPNPLESQGQIRKFIVNEETNEPLTEEDMKESLIKILKILRSK